MGWTEVLRKWRCDQDLVAAAVNDAKRSTKARIIFLEDQNSILKEANTRFFLRDALLCRQIGHLQSANGRKKRTITVLRQRLADIAPPTEKAVTASE